MKKGQAAIIGIVAVVAFVALILLMQSANTGDATRTRARRTSEPTMSATECQSVNVEFHSLTLQIKQRLAKLKIISRQMQFLINKKVFLTPIAKKLTDEEVAELLLPDEDGNTLADLIRLGEIVQIGDDYYEKKGLIQTAITDKIAVLKEESLSIQAQVTQLKARMLDLYASYERCVTITLCPPCPGDSEATVQSICLSDRRSLAAAVTQIDALIVDILIEYERFFGVFRELELKIDVWAKAIIAGTDEEIPVHYQNVITLQQKLVQHFKAVAQIHAEFVKVQRSVAVLEQELTVCLKRRCPDCEEDSYVSVGQRDRLVSVPRDEVAIRTAEPVSQSCEDVCAQQGMSTQPPSSSSIFQQVQQHRCVSGARIGLPRATIGSCTCYGEPKITIDFTRPVCRNTPCGDVPCDGEASCPCPDKPNCVLTVKCGFQWKHAGEYSYKATTGAI